MPDGGVFGLKGEAFKMVRTYEVSSGLISLRVHHRKVDELLVEVLHVGVRGYRRLEGRGVPALRYDHPIDLGRKDGTSPPRRPFLRRRAAATRPAATGSATGISPPG